jgi:PAS domain S-box-containing protein
MANSKRNSLAAATIKKMALLLLLLFLAVAFCSFLYVLSLLGDQTRAQLDKYITERASHESELFELAEDSQRELKDEFLMQWGQIEDADPVERFDELFRSHGDGTLRTPRAYYDGVRTRNNIVAKQITGFIGRDVEVTSEVRRRMVLLYETMNIFGSAWTVWENRFINLWFVTPDNMLVQHMPGTPYALDLAADSFLPEEEWAYFVDGKHNPKRETLWTTFYFDPTSKKWLVSCATPVYAGDKHLFTIGQDILLDEFLGRTAKENLPGTRNLVFRKDGKLIASEGKMEQILEHGGNFDIQQSEDDELQRIYQLILDKADDETVIVDPENGNFLASAIIEGPDWYFVTIYPKRLLIDDAISAMAVILILGVLSLAVAVFFLFRILNRNVGRPLAAFTEATQRIGAGDFETGNDTIDEKLARRGDEIGLLSNSFRTMTGELVKSRAALEKVNDELEGRVKERTEELSRAETRSRLLLESVGEGIFGVGNDGLVTFINPVALEMLGYKNEEVVGQGVHSLIHHSRADGSEYPVEECPMHHAHTEGRKSHRDDEVLWKKGGESFPVDYSATPITDKGDHVVGAVVAFRDITERYKADEALRLAKETAEEATKAKSIFLSNMSHELRTPLNGVLGYVQILQRDRSLGAMHKKSLDSIGNCGEHLLSLINDVLDLSKIEAGELEVSPEPTDLSQLLDGVRDIVKPKAESKGLRFAIKAAPEVPRGIVTDPIKLRQILVNLLGNSVKFTPEGAITLRVAEAPKGMLRFDVEDTGMGIGPEKLVEIFEPFKQAEGGETEGGTGLGLAISRRIAEALGGSLTATSELGDGSCFTLIIPLEETDELKAEGFSVTAPGSDVHFRLPEGEKRSVLIADDRETNRDILDQVLTDAGFETVLATDGDEALEELRKRDFDIFLCDVRMPRMNGIEVVKEIRRDEKLKKAKVFAVTASVFPEFRDQALEAGFDEFLMKPLRVSELAQKMAKILDIEFEGGVAERDEPGSAGEEDPVKLIGGLSSEVIGELAAAAKVSNLTKLSELAARLVEDEKTVEAGRYLEGLIGAFDFAGLQALVDEVAPAEKEK